MTARFCSTPEMKLEPSMTQSHERRHGAIRLRCIRSYDSCIKPSKSLVALVLALAAAGGAAQMSAPRAHAAPAPEVEYLYDVAVRRHYNFANGTDPLTYGHEICDKVSRAESYVQVMGDVKSDVTPNDEFAANYLVSYAVNLLCPDQIAQLRDSAAGYQTPMG